MIYNYLSIGKEESVQFFYSVAILSVPRGRRYTLFIKIRGRFLKASLNQFFESGGTHLSKKLRNKHRI